MLTKVINLAQCELRQGLSIIVSLCAYVLAIHRKGVKTFTVRSDRSTLPQYVNYTAPHVRMYIAYVR